MYRPFVASCLLLFVAASLCATSQAQAPCSAETCPDLPVILFFEYANCTSPVSFRPVTSQAYGVCDDGHLYDFDENLWMHYIVDNVTCAYDEPDATYSLEAYPFGRCQQMDASERDGKRRDIFASLAPNAASFMLLKNANASYTPNQPIFEYDASEPLFSTVMSGSVETCYSADNCTSDVHLWTTTHSEPLCNGTAASTYFPLLELDTCYNVNNESYVMASCTLDPHAVAYSYSARCDLPPYAIDIYRRHCSLNTFSTLHCDLPYVPPLGAPIHSAAAGSSSDFIVKPLTLVVMVIFFLWL